MRRVRSAKASHQLLPTAPSQQTTVPLDDGAVMLAMIQALIPLGLKAVEDALQQEVATLAGPRYAHHDGQTGIARWGKQPGSIYLADQKLPITVPRVRDCVANAEVPLSTYAALQAPRALDAGLFARMLGGLSTREYEAAAEAVPEAFGLAKSSVSRRFIQASARSLAALQERRLDDAEWIAVLLDAKCFAEDRILIALGVTTTGEKRPLGMVQTGTENKAVCAALLRDLEARGFRAPYGLLVVIDGAKGLRAAVRDVYGEDVVVQRCQWHKRENVLSYLTKPQRITWRRKLQDAYTQSSYGDAKRALERLVRELRPINASAAHSLEEGLEETLTLHRLGIANTLGISFSTTNLIENVMSQIERKTHRVNRWRTSDQKLRWCAATLLQVEKRFRRIKGCEKLPLLKKALLNKLHPTKAAA